MKKSRVVLYLFCVISFTLFNFYYRPIEGNKLITKEYKDSSVYINNLYYSNEFFKANILEEKYYSYYEKIIEDIKTGKDNSSFICDSECINAYRKYYYVLYLDHPEFISFQGMGGNKKDGGYQFYYQHLSPIKAYFGTRRIEREIDIIKKETKNMSDKEKILYVYNYVAGHQYDHIFMYSSGNQSAYSFFSKNSSVCAGFAKASQIIFQNIGIQSYPVMSDDHMWNYVEYEGNYYVFDATVGASYVNKKHENYYDGLGRTTINTNTGLYPEIYPKIEEKTLKELFGV